MVFSAWLVVSALSVISYSCLERIGLFEVDMLVMGFHTENLSDNGI